MNQNVIQSIDFNGNIKSENNLFYEKDLQNLKKQNQDLPIQGEKIWDTNKYWSKNDFRNSNTIFESMNMKGGLSSIMERYKKYDICILSFSEPMYFQNKKYLVFTYLKLCISGGNTFVVVLKKIKGKWLRTHEAFNPNKTY